MSKESAYFQIRDIAGKHDTKELKRELDSFQGVLSVSVNTDRNVLAVDYDSTGVTCDRLEKRLEQLGYQVEPCKDEGRKM